MDNREKMKILAEERRQEMLEGQYRAPTDAANYESVSSQLPGRHNGPADAYRHIIWVAEYTRRIKEGTGPFADDIVRKFTQEKEDRDKKRRGASQEAVDMDLHNNEIGLKIGMEANSYEGVVQNARRFIEISDGSGDKQSAKWLSREKWDKNPKRPKLDAQGKEIINPETSKPELEDVPEKDWNWGEFDWVNKVNYKDTNNEQYPNYNARRKERMQSVEEKPASKKDIDRRGSLLFEQGKVNNGLVMERTADKSFSERDLIFNKEETPRQIFGALGQPSTQKPSITLSQPIRSNAPAKPEDIVKLRTGLEALGQIKRPDYGIVPFVDGGLFDDVKTFQKENSLKIDGVINPMGETVSKINQYLQEVF